MLIIAIILFCIAAIVGVVMLVAILQDRPTHKSALFIHGTAAISGLLLVSVYMFMAGASPLLIMSLTLFVLAALGGLTLAAFDFTNKKIPKLLAVVHPLVALAGLIALIVHVLP